MPMKSYQQKVFKNKSYVKSLKRSTSKRYINGQLVDVNSTEFKVQNAAAILKNNNVFTEIPSVLDPDINPIDTMGSGPFKVNPIDTMGSGPFKVGTAPRAQPNTSLSVLAALGVTQVTGYSRRFSFLDTQEEYPLQNPNIIETERLKNLQNKNISARDKFKDKEDPFYNLDEGISANKIRQIQHLKDKKDYIEPKNLAAGFFELNIVNNNNPKLRQFK